METISLKERCDVPRLSRAEAERRHLLSEETLLKMHLLPGGKPVARVADADGREHCYYDPDRVKEAPPSHWYGKKSDTAADKKEPAEESTPSDGSQDTEPRRLSPRRAAALGYYPATVLARMYYEPTEAPVAYYVKKSGDKVLLFDRATCRRLPLPCTKCGNAVRYRTKLCQACYSAELAERRAAGDKKRAARYGMDPDRVLFFDLELTGVYDHDEILSVSIVSGRGETVLDTLVRPVRKKRWKQTEKIHGITPDMVKGAPTLAEIAPRLVEVFARAERLIAFGTSTDYAHLCRIYATREERMSMRSKLLDCGAEFAHYIHEHEVELTHMSLSDAMAHFSLEWNGIAHTSTADAGACRLVFEALFPHYYESEAI